MCSTTTCTLEIYAEIVEPSVVERQSANMAKQNVKE